MITMNVHMSTLVRPLRGVSCVCFPEYFRLLFENSPSLTPDALVSVRCAISPVSSSSSLGSRVGCESPASLVWRSPGTGCPCLNYFHLLRSTSTSGETLDSTRSTRLWFKSSTLIVASRTAVERRIVAIGYVDLQILPQHVTGVPRRTRSCHSGLSSVNCNNQVFLPKIIFLILKIFITSSLIV